MSENTGTDCGNAGQVPPAPWPAAGTRPRFAMVHAGNRVAEHTLYDIVDNLEGSERVMARNVRTKDAQLITFALNRLIQLVSPS